MSPPKDVPIIDVSPIVSSPVFPSPSAEQREVGRKIVDAFRIFGAAHFIGHGISQIVQTELLQSTQEFFSQPEEAKLALHVKNGGVAWRGYLPYGGEGTHGSVDQKEGIYFGPEHPDSHPQAGLPLHGKNQFPDASIPGMRPAVLQYINDVTELGKSISDALSLGLGLEGNFMRENYLQQEPLVFFRAWKYETREQQGNEESWGIGAHSGASRQKSYSFAGSHPSSIRFRIFDDPQTDFSWAAGTRVIHRTMFLLT